MNILELKNQITFLEQELRKEEDEHMMRTNSYFNAWIIEKA
jgi:hypothetical protein